jgi:hypothetical protein
MTNIYNTSGCPWPKATLKPLCENPGPKVEIPSPENHILKIIISPGQFRAKRKEKKKKIRKKKKKKPTLAT